MEIKLKYLLLFCLCFLVLSAVIVEDTRCLSIRYPTKDSDSNEPNVLLFSSFDDLGRIIEFRKEKIINKVSETQYSYKIKYEEKEIVISNAADGTIIRTIKGDANEGFTEVIKGNIMRYDIVAGTLYRGIQELPEKRPIRFEFENGVVTISYGMTGMDQSILKKYPPNVEIRYDQNQYFLVNQYDKFHKKNFVYTKVDNSNRKFKKTYLNQDGSLDELTVVFYELSFQYKKESKPKFFNWEIVRSLDVDNDFDQLAYGMIIGQIDKAKNIYDFF